MLPLQARPSPLQNFRGQNPPRSRLSQIPRFVEKRKEQVQLEWEALGTICRKPQLYYVLLKRGPVPGGGLEDEGPELILCQMPVKEMLWAVDDQPIPWYETNVHWYIVGVQQIYQAYVSIAAKEEPRLARHKFYTEFNVVLVYSRDPVMLIKVSNALNIQVKDKVVTKDFEVPTEECQGQMD